MKKVLILVMAAAMGLSSVAFAANAPTTTFATAAISSRVAPAKTAHLEKHHLKKRPALRLSNRGLRANGAKTYAKRQEIK